MRIVHIEDFFHPDAGYQVNMIAKYMVRQGHEVYVVASQMEKMPTALVSFFGGGDIDQKDRAYSNATGVGIKRVPVWKYVSGRSIYKNEIFKVVEELNPDIVFVHGNDTLIGIQYILKAKKSRFRIVLDSHMLEMASVNKFNKVFQWWYRRFITPQVIKQNLVVIRTQNDDYVQRCLGIPLEQCPWVSVGTDTLLFHPDSMVRENMRSQNQIGLDDFVVIYAGKIDESKGGKLLADAFLKKFHDINRNVVLIVVGNLDTPYGTLVGVQLDQSENKVVKFSTQTHNNLAKYYQMSDLAIFPKQCSLSFYDVQSAGLPVVLEDNNINRERVSFENGSVYDGTVVGLRKAIEGYAQMSREDFNALRNNSIQFVHEKYDYDLVTRRYLELMLK